MTQSAAKIKNFLRLTESDSVWKDNDNCVWVYDAQNTTWVMWSAVDEGGFWSETSCVPNEDFAPYTELFTYYRGDVV